MDGNIAFWQISIEAFLTYESVCGGTELNEKGIKIFRNRNKLENCYRYKKIKILHSALTLLRSWKKNNVCSSIRNCFWWLSNVFSTYTLFSTPLLLFFKVRWQLNIENNVLVKRFKSDDICCNLKFYLKKKSLLISFLYYSNLALSIILFSDRVTIVCD